MGFGLGVVLDIALYRCTGEVPARGGGASEGVPGLGIRFRLEVGEGAKISRRCLTVPRSLCPNNPDYTPVWAFFTIN